MMNKREKYGSIASVLAITIGALLPDGPTWAAPPAVITVDAAADYGSIPKNTLAKCYSIAGNLTDQADLNQMRTLGTDCFVKSWNGLSSATASMAKKILITRNGGSYQDFYDLIDRVKRTGGDKVEFLEFINEPDLENRPAAFTYAAFKAAYTAAYDYNTNVKPAVPVKVGGPAPVVGTRYLANIADFLDLYVADTDPKKALGFISYHLYGDVNSYSNARPRTSKADIVALLRARGLPITIPIFMTESSLFGASRSQDVEWVDMLKQASYMATRDYYLVKQGFTANDANFHWVTRKTDNARKCMLDYSTSQFPNVGPGVATPYLNMLKMQVMLKSTRFYDGESNNDGRGINCFATKDASGIAVMLMNFQQGASQTDFDVTFSINNLSATALNRGKIRVEKYLIDSSHNHCRRAGYDGKILEKLSDTTVDFTNTFSTTEYIGRNAVELIVLSASGATSAIRAATNASARPRNAVGLSGGVDRITVKSNGINKSIATWRIFDIEGRLISSDTSTASRK